MKDTPNARRHWLLLAACFPLRLHAADDPLARLFAQLGAQTERRARFVERRFSALFKAPVESSGTLYFRAPDHLQKLTHEPRRESVRIEANTVIYEGATGQGTQKRTFALSDAPPLAALIESLRATLAGDLPALRRHYDVVATMAEAQWQLTLTPRDRALRDAVTKIVLRGRANEIETLDIVEANGDLTLLRITPVPTPAKQ